MTTQGIAQHLAIASARFPFLGITGARDLLDVVRGELGHEEALDRFVPYANHQTMAFGPETILHIISGNTPHAGLQSLARGLLLKARNLCKIPAGGLPEIAQFREGLPAELAARIEISPELPEGWLEQSDAVIVFGNDETVSHFRRQVRPEQIFIAHGHKISLGIIFDDPHFKSVAVAARDASLFDQQGCLSPHCFYVNASQARAYAEKLAAEMEAFNRQTARGKISQEESAAINEMRDRYEFRATNEDGVTIWKSVATGGRTECPSSDWTVIFDTAPEFTASCLNRVVFVRPLPENVARATAGVRPHLSTIAIHPATVSYARFAAELGATRVCAVGRMQCPPFTWHQDGGQNLGPLVRWVDFEP